MEQYVGGDTATIHVSALAAYQARAIRIGELNAELERMATVRKGVESG